MNVAGRRLERRSRSPCRRSLAAPAFLDNANEVARGTDDTGNLLGPLSPWQLAGIWPSADFRVDPGQHRATIVLVGVALAACAYGAVVAFRHRAWRLLLLLATAVVGALFVSRLVGTMDRGEGARDRLARRPRAGARREARRSSSRDVGSRERSFWRRSSAASRGRTRSGPSDAHLAPRGQLAELEAIGERYAGDGPALMTEYQPYGVRHFLRRLDPEGASELRRRPVPLRDGRLLGEGRDGADRRVRARGAARLPDARPPALRAGRHPALAVPLVERGRYYDVWQRPA